MRLCNQTLRRLRQGIKGCATQTLTFAFYLCIQELLEKVGHHESRVNAAEAKLSEERRRFQNLRDDAERKLEEGAVSRYMPSARNFLLRNTAV